MQIFIEIGIITIVGLLVVLIFFLWRGIFGSKDIELAFRRVLKDIGLSESVGALKNMADEMKKNQRSLESMLTTPTTRGAFGEIGLEGILSEHLPKSMFGIRKRVLDGKIPDAHIKSTVGTICIDSKFVLTNYQRMVDSDNDIDRKLHKKNFLEDVERSLSKISESYVCPEKDSAEFAFAYMPSESVYSFLVVEAYELLRDYTKQGVQVVSPLTLGHKLELIKAGVHAKKLSEEAEKIHKDILKLSNHFRGLDEFWSTLYGSHLKHLKERADDFNGSWRELRNEFERIERISEE